MDACEHLLVIRNTQQDHRRECARKEARPDRSTTQLGGWLLLEPWITPSIFKTAIAQAGATKGKKIIDEYTLSKYYGANRTAEILKSHWDTFYTFKDIQAIKKAGFNQIRIPIGHWAVDLASDEPYAQGQFVGLSFRPT